MHVRTNPNLRKTFLKQDCTYEREFSIIREINLKKHFKDHSNIPKAVKEIFGKF